MDTEEIISKIKERQLPTCKRCQEIKGKVEYWKKRLGDVRSELRVLKNAYKGSDVLEMKRRRLDSDEFNVLENIDGLFEEFQEHLKEHKS